MYNSLKAHGLQHARFPFPSPSPRVCSNSCPLSSLNHLTISSCHPLLLLSSIFWSMMGSAYIICQIERYSYYFFYFSTMVSISLRAEKYTYTHPHVDTHNTGCCSVAKSCLTLCNPMNCSTPGFLGLSYLPELAQTHSHWVSDAIQSSHPVTPQTLAQR